MLNATKLLMCGWSCQRPSRSLVVFLSAALLVPAAASAQVTYTGTTAAQNFGSQPIGSASAATTFSFSVAAGTTVGSIEVVTQGAPNLDFTRATGSTCAATTYTSAATCTVNVTFNPRFAGLRMGAVVFFSAAGNTGTVLGSVLVHGVGIGPQIAFGPGTATATDPAVYGQALGGPTGVAVDGAGDLFIVDSEMCQVLEVAAGSGAATVIDTAADGKELLSPYSVAVDGAGNLFITDQDNFRVVEVPAGGGTPIAITPTVDGKGLSFPIGVAVDSVGDLFIGDTQNNRVVEVPAGGGAAIAIVTDGSSIGGLNQVEGVAVDGAGNLFIADWGNHRVVDVPAGGNSPFQIAPPLGGAPLNYPRSVSVDGVGDLFIGDADRVVEVPAGGGAPFVIDPIVNGTSLDSPSQVAVTSAGDLFIVDEENFRVVEIQRSQPPALSFPTPTYPGSIDTTDGNQTVQVQNIGNEALTLTAVSYPADFSETPGDANACTGSSSVAPGFECDVSVEFTPQNAGALSESVTLTDNALNVAGAQQSIAVSGTGGLSTTPATHFSITTTATVIAGTPFSITVTALTSSNQTATTYSGTVNFTSSDPDFVNPGPLTLTSGVGVATVTLETAGTQTITAMDTTTSSLMSSGSFTVAAGLPPITITAAQNFGSVAIGSTSAVTTLNFSIAAGTTVGSIEVVTQGAPNLDFTTVAGGTCTATTYASATTCTVNVIFKPMFAGQRIGAVLFFSAAGNTGTVVASRPISGIGTGPQIAYSPATVTVIADPTGEISSPFGVAVDGAGNVFFSNASSPFEVLEVPAGGGAAIVINPTVDGKSLSDPGGLALDGAGDLFIADIENSRVVEVPAGGGTATAIAPVVSGLALGTAWNMALDAANDLFIPDPSHNRVIEVPAGGGAAIAIDPTVNGLQLFGPSDVAVDGAGDLFILDSLGRRVVKVPAGGGTPTAILSGFDLSALAVDGAGNLFIADSGNNRVVEVPAGGGASIAIVPAVSGGGHVLDGVAVDGAGDLFITYLTGTGPSDPSPVVELKRSLPPASTFPTATSVGATDTTDGTQMLQIQNIGNEALNFTDLSYPADFSEASGDASACTGSTSLSVGQVCDVPVVFTPQQPGALSESIALTDNALNVTGAQQSIGVTGTALGASHFSITPTDSVFAGVPFTITVTALSSSNQIVPAYNGTMTFVSSDPRFVNPGALKLTDGTGQAVVTFYTDMTQTIQATDTVIHTLTGLGSFNVAALAVLTSPTPGTTVGNSNITFAWTPGYGVYKYRLYLGTNGPGSSNMFASGVTRATSVVVPTLPALGVTVYARLYSLKPVDNVWQYNDYTYTLTAPVLATLTAPTPGTTVGYSNVTFTWTSNQAFSHYRLYLGVNGPGSSDFYSSSETSATSVVVPALPALGVTLYARLFTLNYITNVWQYNDSTYMLAGPILATLTSPTPGTTVGTTNVTFTWTPNYAYSHYRLYLGTRGPGSANVYSSSQTSATSVMVPTIPATGGTLYARLFTLNSETGVWQYNDYTYTLTGP